MGIWIKVFGFPHSNTWPSWNPRRNPGTFSGMTSWCGVAAARKQYAYGGFPKWGYPKIDCLQFTVENPSIKKWFGGTPISGNLHVVSQCCIYIWSIHSVCYSCICLPCNMILATVTTSKSNSCMYDTEFVNGLLQKKQQYRLYNKCGFLKNACICSLYLRLHLCTHCKPRSQFAVRLWHQHRVMLGLILHATDWCLKFLTLTHTR